MSIANHDIEEQDEWQGWCDLHGQYYERKHGCIWCKDMDSERRHDEQQDEEGRAS